MPQRTGDLAAKQLQLAEGRIEKFCFDCAYFLRGSGACVHPKVSETARLVWGPQRTGPQTGSAIDAGLMRLFWCSPRGIFWQRRTPEQQDVDERHTPTNSTPKEGGFGGLGP